MRRSVRLAFAVLFYALLFHAPTCLAARGDARVEISYDKAVGSNPITGRVILIIARSERPEPRFQIGPNATPIFGVDVENLQPGQAAVVDQTTFGHPVDSLTQLPAGDYYVQAMLNVYTKCQRSDGRTLWVHWDMGGRFFNVSPGNLYSEVQKVRLDSSAGYRVSLALNHTVPPVDPPKDTSWIKHLQIKSELLSKFGECLFILARPLSCRKAMTSTRTFGIRLSMLKGMSVARLSTSTKIRTAQSSRKD